MKKRLLTVLLAVCLVVALGTVTAAADDVTVDSLDELTQAIEGVSDGQVIILGSSIEGCSVTIGGEKNLVLDLGGYTLSGTGTVLNICDNANVSVRNGRIESSDSLHSWSTAVNVYNNATFTLEADATVVGAYAVGSVLPSGVTSTTATINIYGTVEGISDASFLANGGTCGLGVNGTLKNTVSYPTIHVYSGAKVTGHHGTSGNVNNDDGPAVYAAGYAHWIFEEGCHVSGDSALSIKSGIIDINGGEFVATGTYYAPATPNGNGTESTGAAISITANSSYAQNVEINILDGTFTSQNGHAIYEAISNDTDTALVDKGLTITGGTLTAGSDPSAVAVYHVNGNVTIADDANLIGDVSNAGTGNLVVDGATVTGSIKNIGEGAIGDTVVVNNATVTGTVPDTATIVNSSVDGEVITTEGVVAMVGSTPYYDLSDAITEADSGDTITLVNNVTTDATVTIPGNKNLTIVGNGNSIVINHNASSGETQKALSLSSNLTLNDVTLTINGHPGDNGTHIGDGIEIYDAELAIVNGSKVTLDGVKNAMVMPGGADAKVTVKDSEFTLNDIGGNGSNGGTYVFNNADINVDGCDSYGFSVYNMTTSGNTTIDISNTSFSAIYGHTKLDFGGNTVVNVSNCGKGMPSGAEQWGYRDAPIQLRRGPDGAESINIGENAVINITGCTDKDGNSINNIYVVAGTTYTNNGTVNANVVMEAAPAGQNTVKVINNGVTIYSGYVADNTSFKLPTPDSRNGYTFGGWRSGNTVYKAGETVTINSNTTFTAIWNAINIPDTYDIDLIVSDGGEAKTNLSNASAGTTITVTVTPDDGYELDYITVDGERISGTTFKMPDHDVTVRVYFTDGTSALPFTDVSANQWFYEAVSYVYTNGMMEGDSATTFNPDGRMTRAMFWAVLGRIDGATITGANWVETARSWAMAEGVSDGTNPNDYVTREMMVTMLWRYAGEPASDESLSGYTDAASVSDWAAEAMSWALETGVIEGVTATTLQPQGTATRAQCATIFMRYDMI